MRDNNGDDKGNGSSNKGLWVTKRARAARAARAKALAMRVAVNKEGNSKGGGGNGNGNEVAGKEEGDCKHHLYDYSYQCTQ